ncbi:MAG TPA: hypothetical protein VEG61_05860 [Candidatus Dormibacteraeota bacterium]|nr:hypothetical protein [Candidatus Dormibacteraeota bacterium]
MREFTLPGVQIPTRVPIALHDFTDFFRGFEEIPAVRSIFGDGTEKVLRSLKVEFFSSKFGYMGVSDEDGHLIVSAYYLREGEPISKYLDVIHELVHVKQFMDGKPLFDENYEYHNRPTELEAYKLAIAEGRRLGMSDKELFDYLKVDWMSEDEVRKLANNLSIKVAPKRALERVR